MKSVLMTADALGGVWTYALGHSCVLSWWQAVKGETAPSGWERYRQAVARGLACVDRVVVPTRAMRVFLQAHYGERSVLVIPNGREPSRFRAGAKDDYILAAGRIRDEGKNLRLLDDIAPDLPWPVYLAGSCAGPWRKAVPAHARALGPLTESEMAARFRRAALFAHPAKYEPFGLCVLEAGLSGCALVLGDIPSLRENWEGAADFLPPDDPGAWRRAFEDLIADPSRRREAAGKALRRARDYSARAMTQGYVAVYRELCP